MSTPGGVSTRLTHVRWGEWPVADDWRSLTEWFFSGDEGVRLLDRLERRLQDSTIVYPPEPLRALQLTPLADTRVVILGQDPYHGQGQAEGLAFSVAPGVRVPPSLRNIYKELQRDLGLAVPSSGSLSAWARQGVLLLNACLTVEDGLPGSHARWGWTALTTQVLATCNASPLGTVFMLWGAHAQSMRGQIDETRHLVLTANHPSPLSALRPPVPFIGCGHFSLANRWLAARGREEVNWLVDRHKTVA